MEFESDAQESRRRPTTITSAAAMQALTMLLLIFAGYLTVQSSRRPQRGAVLDDDAAFDGHFPGAWGAPAGADGADGAAFPAGARVYRAAVVDGGSGKTAVARYACELGGYGCAAGTVRELQGGARFRADAAGIVADRRAWSEYMDAIEAAAGGLAVSAGLTGGARAALAAGDLTQADVDAFFRAVRERFGATARRPAVTFLRLLSGGDEAELEYEAAAYIAAATFGVDAVGVLSGGGASAQLAAGGLGSSLNLDLFAAQRNAAEIGDAAALRAWIGACDAAVGALAPALVARLASADLVLFVSMHASAGAAAGVGGARPIAARDAVAALDALVAAAASPGARWDDRAGALPNPYGLDATTLRRSTLFSAARASRIARVLPGAAAVVFSRAYGDPPLTCDWALGMFLAAAEASDVHPARAAPRFQILERRARA